MNSNQLRQYVIEPALEYLKNSSSVPRSKFMEDLLIATAAVETFSGFYIHQINGPALGIYQIEPNTAKDCLRFCERDTIRWAPLLDVGNALTIDEIDLDTLLTSDLRYQTWLARIKYYMVPAPLPFITTMEAIWQYYKPHWNTEKGATTFETFSERVSAYAAIEFEG